MTPRAVQHRGGQPGPDRCLGQHRVQRVPEPHAVQGVPGRAGPQPPDHPLGGRDHPIQGPACSSLESRKTSESWEMWRMGASAFRETRGQTE